LEKEPQSERNEREDEEILGWWDLGGHSGKSPSVGTRYERNERERGLGSFGVAAWDSRLRGRGGTPVLLFVVLHLILAPFDWICKLSE